MGVCAIFTLQWPFIMLVVFTKYLTDSYYNFFCCGRWFRNGCWPWQPGSFHADPHKMHSDRSSTMQLVILSAWLAILLMVVYAFLVMEALIAGPDCQESGGSKVPALWLFEWYQIHAGEGSRRVSVGGGKNLCVFVLMLCLCVYLLSIMSVNWWF